MNEKLQILLFSNVTWYFSTRNLIFFRYTMKKIYGQIVKNNDNFGNFRNSYFSSLKTQLFIGII